jgi:hypothetical protein
VNDRTSHSGAVVRFARDKKKKWRMFVVGALAFTGPASFFA